MSSEDAQVEEKSSPSVENGSDEKMEEENLLPESSSGLMDGEELDYEAVEANDIEMVGDINEDAGDASKNDNVDDGGDREVSENREKSQNGDTENGDKEKNTDQMNMDVGESEVVNCKDFGVTILAADGVAVESLGVSDTVTNKDNQPEEQAGGSSIETDPAVLCKPCNLVFESDKWCTRHKQSGDHLHVVKGGIPGRGRYHCFLCWMSFQHSEALSHHIGRSDHLKRAKRKGVRSVWMKPGSKGGASVSPRDLREHITGRGDLREHLSGRRDHGGSRGKEHESYRDRDRYKTSSHHRSSRGSVVVYLDHFYEVDTYGDCDIGNCKPLRKIRSSSSRAAQRDGKNSTVEDGDLVEKTELEKTTIGEKSLQMECEGTPTKDEGNSLKDECDPAQEQADKNLLNNDDIAVRLPNEEVENTTLEISGDSPNGPSGVVDNKTAVIPESSGNVHAIEIVPDVSDSANEATDRVTNGLAETPAVELQEES